MGSGALWRDNQQSTFAHIHTSSSHSTTSPWSPIPYPHCVSTQPCTALAAAFPPKPGPRTLGQSPSSSPPGRSSPASLVPPSPGRGRTSLSLAAWAAESAEAESAEAVGLYANGHASLRAPTAAEVSGGGVGGTSASGSVLGTTSGGTTESSSLCGSPLMPRSACRSPLRRAPP